MHYSFKLSDLDDADIYAIEAINGEREIETKVDNPDAPMAIALITDKIIMNSNLQQVTDPISHSSGIPTDGGLFSNIIFGRTGESRQKQFAYIDLYEKFFHPYVYEILKSLMPKRFEKCAYGEGTSWKISEEGELVQLKPDDPDFNEENSGIQWLISNFHKMRFKE